MQGRLFVKEYRDLQLCSYPLSQSFRQMDTILHRRAMQRHKGHDVRRPHPRVHALVLPKIDEICRYANCAKGGFNDGVRFSGKAQDGAMVVSIHRVVQQPDPGTDSTAFTKARTVVWFRPSLKFGTHSMVGSTSCPINNQNNEAGGRMSSLSISRWPATATNRVSYSSRIFSSGPGRCPAFKQRARPSTCRSTEAAWAWEDSRSQGYSARGPRLAGR